MPRIRVFKHKLTVLGDHGKVKDLPGMTVKSSKLKNPLSFLLENLLVE